MDIGEEISDPLKVEKGMNNDDIKFCSFYYRAVKQLLDLDNRANVCYLHRYFKILCEYYDFWGKVRSDLPDHDDVILHLLKDSLYYRLAFVYKNATLLSSAVSFHFRNICKQSPKIIKNLMKKKLVKICSLGGCSASDIVAIVTVLESIALKNDIKLDFRVTIIESDERWKVTCFTILNSLRQFHWATWKINFIQGNFAKKDVWTPKTCKAIQEADIISMIRFLSKYNLKEKILKDICGKLKPQALLFALDHPVTELIELSFDISDSDDFELIHVELLDFHALEIEVLKHSKTLYRKHFGNKKHFKINLNFNVFICVWIKAFPESAEKRQNKIERIFQNNMEKYNPKQSFLSTRAFEKWEKAFTQEKEAAGYSAKGIRKIVLEEKEKRSRLLAAFLDERKNLDTIQMKFLTRLCSLKEEGKKLKEIDEDILKIYLNQKIRYSEVKKNTYKSSFLFY